MVTDINSLEAQLPDKRLHSIKHWVETELDIQDYKIEVASADASFRRYFRLLCGANSWVIMDAPPEKEDCTSFVRVANLIEAAGVQAPHIFNFNEQEGFMQLSDLGNTAYLDELDEQSVEVLYKEAIQAIVKMQGIKAELPQYNTDLLRFEMSLFKDWYLQKHMGLNLTQSQSELIAQTFDLLVQSALEQAVVFVHRDFHSRNLMITEQNNPGVIDFQDAVNGPISYDLVSLIKDCYIAWPRDRQLEWIDCYLELSELNIDKQVFIKALDLMGMQRHLKAIGIFARLNHRDGKPGYLNDIPRTMTYVLDVCNRYKELSDFSEMLNALGVKADTKIMQQIK